MTACGGGVPSLNCVLPRSTPIKRRFPGGWSSPLSGLQYGCPEKGKNRTHTNCSSVSTDGPGSVKRLVAGYWPPTVVIPHASNEIEAPDIDVVLDFLVFLPGPVPGPTATSERTSYPLEFVSHLSSFFLSGEAFISTSGSRWAVLSCRPADGLSVCGHG